MSTYGYDLFGNLIHSDVLFGIFAECSGMATIQVTSLSSSLAAIKSHGKLSGVYGMYMAYANPVAEQMIMRMLLGFVCETCVQVNMQVKFFAMVKATFKGAGQVTQYQARPPQIC